MTTKIYGPEIKWNGGECPVSPNTRVRVERQYGSVVEDLAKNLYWFHDLDNNNIFTYCTVTEQADLDAAEKLLLSHGYAITPPAKPLTFEDIAPYVTAMIGASHLSDAADTIDNLRTLLAEAQRDAERLDWIIEHRAYVVSDPDCCDGYWLNYARPDGTLWTQVTEHETPRAAIDAAKGGSNA